MPQNIVNTHNPIPCSFTQQLCNTYYAYTISFHTLLYILTIHHNFGSAISYIGLQSLRIMRLVVRCESSPILECGRTRHPQPVGVVCSPPSPPGVSPPQPSHVSGPGCVPVSWGRRTPSRVTPDSTGCAPGDD